MCYRRSTVLRIAAVAGLTTVTGCFGFVSPFAIPELPEALTAILANEAQFQLGGDHALSGTLPGTVIGDLSGLDGCWGRLWRNQEHTGFVIALAIRFDVANGTYTRWSMQDISEYFRVLAIDSGTFEVLDAGRILLTMTVLHTNDPYTGDLTEQTPFEGGPIEHTALVTVDGDDMLLAYGLDDQADLDPNDLPYYHHHRLDCPE